MPQPEPACRLKAARFSLPVLHFDQSVPEDIAVFIQQQMERARALLENAPILLAPAESLADLDLNQMQAIIETCRKHQLHPVGLLPGPAAERWQSHCGLRIIQTGMTRIPEPENPAEQDENLCLDRPVRSGQQAMAARGTLTILAGVSATAEVLARDDIHIHGALKGKALAGIQGNEQARIICHRFEAELVAIAGHYRLFDEADPDLFGKAVCVELNEDQLQFRVLPHS